MVITTIGVQEGRMRTVNAAALAGAGTLSVLLYPMIARILLDRARPVMEPEVGLEIDGSQAQDGPGIQAAGS